MKNILITIEYDGTNFFGWQRQPDKRTVQGEVEKALSTICASSIKINGTSRTDAGVHAFGQRASFKADFKIPVERIKVAANNLLAGGQNSLGAAADVRIIEVAEVPMDFHARFNAVAKTYIYKIRNCKEADVFDRNYSYQITKPLNIGAMKKGAAHMVGTHDFKCFQAAGGKEMDSTVRTITSLEVCEDYLEDNDKIITIAVTGDGFLYNMVRIITGTLVDIGKGKISEEKIPEIIKEKKRENAGHTAPPQGLYLAEIYYK
ncbi:tRNA pseudouridine(38-40) synthase TruA [Anaerovorax odorimutans]|uniref:tRNA pseudouridine(38-40) synthase TruA n=1 Tax=Anaerovorax odorimutans TaxID=109327 RepID=UPI00040EB92C|nr:tRNA pseudouridine(38-40) synthase TruA [Anaerovorax odorimutans]